MLKLNQHDGRRMSNSINLSIVISAYNNADQIKDCIKSVRFADEVIVIDNQSTDDTAKLAKSAGARVFTQPNNPNMLNTNKNFGFRLVKGDWTISLDTDERIDPELANEINQIISSDSDEYAGYLIPRKNIIFGKWIQHGLWYPDHQLRLFKSGQGKFPQKHNHELLQVKGKVGYCKHHITHFNYHTISQYLQKIDKQYSNNEADVFIKNGKKVKSYDAIRFPAQDFLTNYFAREGYKDGLHGLVLSILQAFYMFIVFAKIWERQNFKPNAHSLDQTESELKRFTTQLKYWFLHERQKTASLPKKLILKIKSLL